MLTFEQKARRAGLAFFAAWLVGAAISLSITGLVIYAAIHFIHKCW